MAGPEILGLPVLPGAHRLKDDGPITTAELTITTDDPVEASRQYQRLIRGTGP